MTTFSLSMVVNWDNCHKPSLRKIFITRKKVGLIEYFHSCYCSSGNSFEKAVQLEKELDRFDNEMRRRANERFEKEHPNGVPDAHWTDESRWD